MNRTRARPREATGTVPLFRCDDVVSTSDDYYTPRWVFETMDLTFDLDVCTPPGGLPWIPAARYYTRGDDGLAQDWLGRVWMNPPFSRPSPWVDRFIWHGHGVALLPVCNTAWGRRIWQRADGVVMLRHPTKSHFEFAQGGGIPISCCVYAFGADCVEGIERLGRAR
jgi:hypothetical protein